MWYGCLDREGHATGARGWCVVVCCGIFLAFPHFLIAELMATESLPSKIATLESKLKTLKANAAQYGGVRAIVSVAPPEHGDETSPQVETAKKRLIDRLRGPDAPVIQPIEGTPYVVMELTARGVERLASDPTVRNVQEDRPERTQ